MSLLLAFAGCADPPAAARAREPAWPARRSAGASGADLVFADSPLAAAERRAALIGVRGTYSAPPLTVDGRLDVARLIDELVDVGANTYDYLVRHSENDWDDLKRLLPAARAKNINVWVTIAPPSKPANSLPFGGDLERWARELATLSLREPNLVAWGVDDLSHHPGDFTRDRLIRVLGQARAINPKLAFAPTVYYRHAIEPRWIERLSGVVDGILFPYRAESTQVPNLDDPNAVAMEIDEMRTFYGPKMPIVLDVYASPHSKLGESSPEYVRQVIRIGGPHADGVMIFRHQPPGTPKWEIVKDAFHPPVDAKQPTSNEADGRF